MKIRIITFIALILSLSSCEKDKIITHHHETLKPNATQGIDAFIYDLEPDRNLGTHPDFTAIAGTNEGIPVIVRGLMKFDFSSIPNDAIIDSVRLSLYSYDSPSNFTHRTDGGSNSCVLQKVVTDWDEDIVTWNNQPSITENNQVVLVQSQFDIQDYLNIDVTSLFIDMIKNVKNNYGFMLKLETEEYYRTMLFASSDNEDSNLHPKLDIYYTIEE